MKRGVEEGEGEEEVGELIASEERGRKGCDFLKGVS
jgi:hypothetical protein